MEKYVDLSNCKRQSDGKIMWNQSIGAVIPFKKGKYDGYIKIIDYYGKGKLKIQYKDSVYDIYTESIKKCSFLNILKNEYLYEIGQIINNKQIISRRIENRVYGKNNITHHLKMYTIRCLLCGKESEIEEHSVENNVGCINCHSKGLICEERPDLLQYFTEENLHYFYELKLYSNIQLEFKCPICGNKKVMYLSNLVKSGYGCTKCGDGTSSGEKFMQNILDQSNIQYVKQFEIPNSLLHYNNEPYQPKYDFYIPSQNTIIEIDGDYHRNDTNHRNYEETKNKDELKNLLAIERGYTIIRIPYYSMKFDELYEEILRNVHFLPNNLDCNEAKNVASKSIIYDICNYWNDGFKIKEICEKMQYYHKTIKKYLRLGKQLGLCDYTEEKSKRRSYIGKTTKIKCLNNGMIFNSLVECSRKSEEIFGLHINANTISANINHRTKYINGNLEFIKYNGGEQ